MRIQLSEHVAVDILITIIRQMVLVEHVDTCRQGKHGYERYYYTRTQMLKYRTALCAILEHTFYTVAVIYVGAYFRPRCSSQMVYHTREPARPHTHA